MKRFRIKIQGMTCTHCETTVAKALEKASAIVLRVSYRQGVAEVETDKPPEVLKEAIHRVGYSPIAIETEPTDSREDKPEHLLVIGSGSAGFAAAIRARELGAEVTMVAGPRFGGTCVNIGCVPSKFLIHRAEILHAQIHPPSGLAPCGHTADLSALQDAKDALIQTLLKEKYQDVADAWGITVKQGIARFISPSEVKINGEVFHFQRVIIATGAKPWIPPIKGLEEVGYWTSTEALEARSVPRRLAVIGANAVGLELAQAFSRLGSHVTLIEAQPRIAPFEEEIVSEVLRGHLEKEGIRVLENIRIRCVEKTSQGKRILCQDALEPIDVDEILVATGRKANTEALNLEAAGVERDDRGFIRVNTQLQTTNPHIYAAGDVTPHPQLVYLASRMGRIAAENALGGNKPFDPTTAPRVIFTDPQVASVGLTETQAKEQGIEIQTTVMDLSPVARARVEDREGIVKMIADSTGRLLGVHIVSPHAGEVIYAAHLALLAGLTVQDFVESYAPYLTYAESLRLAAQTFAMDVHKLSCCA